MRFDKLNEMIPHVVGTKKHVVTMQPYNAITLAMPGRHQHDTPVPGADFVVMVSDENMEWVNHQFTHNDLFSDFENKKSVGGLSLLSDYLRVVRDGVDPEKIDTAGYDDLPGIHPQTLLYAVQCLAVAEHRRYAKFETKFGGRFLPFRFAAGVAEGLWDTNACIGMQRRGRPGVEILEKVNGTPTLTKELMSD